jgi:hypothetical protein
MNISSDWVIYGRVAPNKFLVMMFESNSNIFLTTLRLRLALNLSAFLCAREGLSAYCTIRTPPFTMLVNELADLNLW